MQSVADEPSLKAGLELEIRSTRPRLPLAAPDLQTFGACLLEESRLLCFEGQVDLLTPEQVVALADPLTEHVSFECPTNGSLSVDVFCRAGVTDAEGEVAAQALSFAGLPGLICRAGIRYRFAGSVSDDLRPAVERLLGNPLIHQFLWSDEAKDSSREDVAHAGHHQPVEVIDLEVQGNSGHGGPRYIDGRCGHGGSRGDDDGSHVARAAVPAATGPTPFDDDHLMDISRRYGLALDLEEMRAIAVYYRGLGRSPTDVELQSLALTWSEHCSHKSFKATLAFECDGRGESIPGLLQTYLMAPTRALDRPWVRSAFDDNAGVIALDGHYDLAVKVETHNHPSALEPFGGAHTGVGGVIRDILAVSAEPIANTDVLCFGPPDLPVAQVPAGVFHPARTYREVVRGIADYGNNMGIPTVGGAVLFHSGYTANPLVYCGTLGLVPRGSHPRDPRPSDLVVLLGGRTGRDGLHGATMSSATLDRESIAGSTVQIGAPITEKMVRDALPHLRDERLFHAITDCGAGGLCSAVGEMGAALGVEVELSLVPLKYQGLRPWEIWLSEAQERMVLAVPRESLPRLAELCRRFDVETTVLGTFRDDGRLLLRYQGQIVADLEMDFMHGGRPSRVLQARWEAPPRQNATPDRQLSPADALLRLLAHPTIASKEDVIRRYDHEVGAGTLIKPLVGRSGPSDAAVLQPHSSRRGVVVSHGINPLYSVLDPHAMAMLAVDEALRNLVAVGGSIDRTALLDNFCWGEVDSPEGLGSLVRAVQGCRDAAMTYGTPFISGKDSLRNTSVDAAGQHSIPGTLLITAVGIIPDPRRTVTMDLKAAGSAIYLLGRTLDELGGSHYHEIQGADGGSVPRVRSDETPHLMRRLTRAIRQGPIRSCHDLSEGGLAVAAAEMSLAGGLGLDLDLSSMPADTDAPEALLFSESPGRFLVEVDPEKQAVIEALFAGSPYRCIGHVTANRRFKIRYTGKSLIDLPVEEIDQAWRGVGRALSAPNVAQDCSPSSIPSPTPLPSPNSAHSASLPCPSLGDGRPEGRSYGDAGDGRPEGRSYGDAGDGRPEGRSYGDAGDGRPEGRSYVDRTGTVGTAARVLILTAAGINCDRETLEACRLAGAEAKLVHLNQLISGERKLLNFGMLVLPGGFSYGDHLGAGAMLATVLRHRFLGELQAFIGDGRPVLGICNGFQVLARLGLLGDVTLAVNASDRFECRWVRLRVEPSGCPFLQGLEVLDLPIAHGQGRVVVSEGGSEQLLERAPLRYCGNPNGSVADIAGVCNPAGNVLGLMPHPERYLTPQHHPDWPRGVDLPPLGLTLFQNAVRYVEVL